MKRILIDVNSIVMRRGRTHLSGIGRTTVDLLQAMSKIENLPFEIQLYFQGRNSQGLNEYNLPFPSFYLPVPHVPKYNRVITHLRLKEIFSRYDLLHIPHNYELAANPQNAVVTLHDAMFFSFPDTATPDMEKAKKIAELAVKCKGIITCSESSKRDIVEYMNVKEDKVTVVPWGVSGNLYFPESQDNINVFKHKWNIRNPYYIMVSCDMGRKNTISLLKAFDLYLKRGGNYDLVLVWKNPPKDVLSPFQNTIEKGRIRIISHLNMDDLRTAYSGAVCSFFPSKYEGFGLPILESMACGTPVVTCKNSSLEEVGRDMALYTEPEDVECMSQYMFDFEIDKYTKGRNVKELEEYATQFSWEKVALGYIEFYKKYL